MSNRSAKEANFFKEIPKRLRFSFGLSTNSTVEEIS